MSRTTAPAATLFPGASAEVLGLGAEAGSTTGSRPTATGTTDENPTATLHWTSPHGRAYTVDEHGTLAES